MLPPTLKHEFYYTPNFQAETHYYFLENARQWYLPVRVYKIPYHHREYLFSSGRTLVVGIVRTCKY